MKATGIVRRIDELGRIVLPIDVRRTLCLNEKDPVEIFTDDDSIILKKFISTCVFCSNTENLISYNGSGVCRDCIDKISKLKVK